MKVILSRKGFDSTAGSYPSPIINGQPLSLPIPDKQEFISYSMLNSTIGKNYFEIMAELVFRNYSKDSLCHLDPDLDYKTIDNRPSRNDWRGTLGQRNQAQIHLENKGVTVGDLFLFFGWFKEAEIINGKVTFKRSKKYPEGFHCLYGYMEIDRIIKTATQDAPEWLQNHPHFSREDVRSDISNTIYIGAEKLALRQNQAGFGILPFSDKLILTKEGHPRSHWDLDKLRAIRDLTISYHRPNSWKADYFQSAGRGQEFVIKESEEAKNWALKFLKTTP
jgi:hypothetical protein